MTETYHPSISVALCTHNGASFIAEQIDSILAQDLAPSEVVIVDDCSIDGTFDILLDYARRHEQVSVYRNDAHLGFNLNFERALSLTKGEMIAISDQDDIWEPEKLAVLAGAIGVNWLAASNSILVDNSREKGFLLPPGAPVNGICYKALLLNNLLTGHTMLLKRSLLERVLPFPATGYYDWWIGFIALYHRKAVYVDQPLTRHRIHEHSFTHTENAKKNNFAAKIIKGQLLAFLGYRGLEPGDGDFIRYVSLLVEKSSVRPVFSELTRFVFRNYPVLFPVQKARNGLRRLNFARRFSQGIRNG